MNTSKRKKFKDKSHQVSSSQAFYKLPPISSLEKSQLHEPQNNKYLNFRLSQHNQNKDLKNLIDNAEKKYELFERSHCFKSSIMASHECHPQEYYLDNLKQIIYENTNVTSLPLNMETSILDNVRSLLNIKEDKQVIKDYMDEVKFEYSHLMAVANLKRVFGEMEDSKSSEQEQWQFRCVEKFNFRQKQQNIKRKLFITHKLLKKIQRLFDQYFTSTLFDENIFRFTEPLEATDFKEALSQSICSLENDLMKTWFKKLSSFLSTDKVKFSLLEFPRLTSTLKTNLSLRISVFLKNSISTYADMITDRQNNNILLTSIIFVLSGDIVEVKPSVSELEKIYIDPINEMTCALRNIPSIESFLPKEHTEEYLKVYMCPDFIIATVLTLKNNLENDIEQIERICNDINLTFQPLIKGEIENDNEKCLKDKFNTQTLSLRLKLMNDYISKVNLIPDAINVKIIVIQLKELKEILKNCCLTMRQDFILQICNTFQTNNLGVYNKLDNIRRELLVKPCSIEEMIMLRNTLKEYQTKKMKEFEVEISYCRNILLFLMQFPVLRKQEMTTCSQILMWAKKMGPVLQSCTSTLEESEEHFKETIQTDLEVIHSKIEEVPLRLEKFEEYGEIKYVKKYSEELAVEEAFIAEVQERINSVNRDENFMKYQRTKFPKLDQTREYFEIFKKLYKLILDWKESKRRWMNGSLIDFDADNVDEEIVHYQHEALKCEKSIKKLSAYENDNESAHRSKLSKKSDFGKEMAKPLNLLEDLLNEIKEFKSNLLIFSIFCNQGLQERHWELMTAETELPLTNQSCSTLLKCLEFDFKPEVLDTLSNISVSAHKEHSLEKALDKLIAEWDSTELMFTRYKDTGVDILCSVEHIQTLLDDQLTKLQSIKGSTFVKHIIKQVKEFEDKLLLTQEMMDEWLTLQSSWLYLEPIFFSEDIMLQMPVEGQLFNQVDSLWRQHMKRANGKLGILEVTTNTQGLKDIILCNELIEKINHGLNSYLETKRLYFPRFFFLSNDEMLEILSETKDSSRVQPHLKKCFEGIARLKFDENYNIHAMFSNEGEQVDFQSSICTADAKGQVEKWLLQVQNEMVNSVRFVLKEALEDYSDDSRLDWILKWPGQIILCASQMIWTQNVHQCIKEGGKQLEKYLKVLQQQLLEVVNLVRGKLPALARIALGALVVVDVHAKDVVCNLIEKGIVDENDFNWLAQLRYYWQEENCVVKIINAHFNYAYEYLGNTGRLVITPLTDRCYRTLMGAFHLHLNGAPEGPAGTGKTETTKDLAKALAVQCVVFNCSDGLDYIAMGKFFKGLASSGAWACFDEFNRIDLEVLSVVAQQILSIMQAVQINAKSFIFEGTELNLNPNCYVCITMNPGYAGRSELPDNLKVLFRTVAMMVPDYSMIGEIMLYSYGFLDARSLSRKIVTTYRLCSEQLSSQNHYDYGMRAVKAVLAAAGQLKLKYPEEDENILILKSIVDINLPKFLAHDVTLFMGIISDLFPNVTIPKSMCQKFKKAINEVCKQENLQPTEKFVEKIIQSYEMMIVRHGFMLVGEPFSGKTKILDVLAKTLNLLHQQGNKEYHQVVVEIINPKSMTIGQLFGQFDPISHEWTDGVAAKIFRNFSTAESDERKWIIFDGPVDTLWIESMNTALDDNKKLCLMSGEIIQLPPMVSMIFEVMDLAQASPATVSRCGMVYVQPSTLGWESLVLSWINQLNESWNETNKKNLLSFIFWLLPPCLTFMRTFCRELIVTNDCNLAQSMMHLIEALIKSSLKGEEKFVSNQAIAAICLFAVTWSVGGTCDHESQEKFNIYLQELCHKRDSENFPIILKDNLKTMPPPGESFYDYYVSFEENFSWKPWKDLVSMPCFEKMANVKQVIIPTVDYTRTLFFLDLCILNFKNMLFVGPTGTGKSIYIKDKLLNHLPNKDFLPAILNFSAQTSPALVQAMIESKLEKKRKNFLGPPTGKKFVFFIDDLNMPAKDEFGSQSPIELLRYFLDHNSWYTQKGAAKIQLNDLFFVSAMLPPGGGRNSISPRFLRHFHIMAMNPFSAKTLNSIFSAILCNHLQDVNCNADIKSLVPKIVSATNQIYQSLKSCILPTPSKLHYTFNLRDFSKVILGCCMMKPDNIKDELSFIRLWIHEVYRVFHDRLIDDANDKLWLFNEVEKTVEKNFQKDFCEVLKPITQNYKVKQTDVENLIFGDFMNNDRSYCEVNDYTEFHKKIEEYVIEYNSMHSSPINLVLFRYALSHLSRICRILRTPGGHALLVGIGGSGRHSLTKLACDMNACKFLQVKASKSFGLPEWREFLKTVLKSAGMHGKKVVFFVKDSDVKDDCFFDDIDSLLNSGEVVNLFSKEEKQEIIDISRTWVMEEVDDDSDISPLYIYSKFVARCQENLHIIVALSPVNKDFSLKLRMFPSLINCCTIDWFHNWPEDALESVAKKYLSDIDIHSQLKIDCVAICKYFHTTAYELSERFMTNAGRKTYITPSSYMDLINLFKILLKKKQNEVQEKKMRYVKGLDKIAEAEKQIVLMKKELQKLQPQLATAKSSTEEMIELVASESKEAEKFRELVSNDEMQASIQANHAQALKEECESDLDEAMPILNEALAALDTLKPADITVVKSMKSPPEAVKLVMAAICVMNDIKPDRINDPSGSGSMMNDYWGPSKRLLSDMSFLDKLKAYDKDNISPSIISKIRKSYVNLEVFNPQLVAKASSAAQGLCMWVIAMDKYERISKVVEPKKIRLEEAEIKLADTMRTLEAKQKELEKAESKLRELQNQLDEMNQRKVELENQVKLCSDRLERAEQLIGGLEGEKIRWMSVAQELDNTFNNLVGNILISSAFIAYLGPFTLLYRNECLNDWINFVKNCNFSCSEKFNLGSTLSNPLEVQDWHMRGLPYDDFSVDNATIIQNAFRWPLLIDPQGQANYWLKSTEKDLNVIKLSDVDYLRQLENCIQFGKVTLIEDVNEDLDPTLMSIFNKETFKQGRIDMIMLGEKAIEFNHEFKLYMTTKMYNPHYLPDLSSKLVLINFMITSVGLEEQLLGILLNTEKPILEKSRQELFVQAAKNNRALTEVEDKILHTLSSSGENILDDKEAIQILDSSKTISQEIIFKQKVAKETEKVIELSRLEYRPLAKYSSVLFNSISSLSNIDFMYQYSLKWFINLFLSSINQSGKSDDLEIRLSNIKDHFTYNLYCNICRSLFEKDKLVFSFVMCWKLMLSSNLLTEAEQTFYLTGGITVGNSHPNPDSSWLPDYNWNSICQMSNLSIIPKSFLNDFIHSLHQWKKIYLSSEINLLSLPEPFNEKLSKFQKLMLMTSLRPDKVAPLAGQLISDYFGPKFVNPPAFDLQKSFTSSSNNTPLIFILSRGSDPMSTLIRFAESYGVTNEKLHSISLGQGQGPLAESLIKEGRNLGYWVVLQNCHLAESWLNVLERICDGIAREKNHSDFRLWLTSYPSKKFPISILQNGIKITNEPPSSLKMNLLQSYKTDPINDPEFFNGCKAKQKEFKELLYSLCLFDGILHERLKFGSQGWNNAYNFNESDLKISVRELLLYINNYREIPYDAIQYLIGECNYGGRVTDEFDRRCLRTLLADFINPNVIGQDMEIEDDGDSSIMKSYDCYIEKIEIMPLEHSTEIFGMHENISISKNILDSKLFKEKVLATHSVSLSESGFGKFDDSIIETIEAILSKLPSEFDIVSAQRKHPVKYEDSLNTVLIQEMERFNRLLNVITSSLHSLKKAIEGEAVMNNEIEAIGCRIAIGKIPHSWSKVSYPSVKPLHNYIEDFLARIKFLQEWNDQGKPTTYWISGFFFTQAFLTGVIQNHARKYSIPVDQLEFDFEVVSNAHVDKPPNDGVYINGLYLDCARWDARRNVLEEQYPGILFHKMPVIWLKPQVVKNTKEIDNRYYCPVYKTSERRGELTTTGHSSNYVMTIKLNSNLPPSHWVKRGTALLCQLDQ